MNYYFNKVITKESINDLVEKITNTEGKINLWFSTEGGDVTPMYFLCDVLNERKEDIEITLVETVMSAGIILLVEFKGKINFSEHLDCLMFHMFDRQSYSLRKGYLNEKVLTKQDFETNKIFAKKLEKKGFLNKKQIKKCLKGEDIILYKNELNSRIHKDA